MHTTIIRKDDKIHVNGEDYGNVDRSGLPAHFSVLQWDGESGSGWIEFLPDENGDQLPDLPVTDFSPYQSMLDDWNEARTLQEQAVAQAKLAAQIPPPEQPEQPPQEQVELPPSIALLARTPFEELPGQQGT